MREPNATRPVPCADFIGRPFAGSTALTSSRIVSNTDSATRIRRISANTRQSDHSCIRPTCRFAVSFPSTLVRITTRSYYLSKRHNSNRTAAAAASVCTHQTTVYAYTLPTKVCFDFNCDNTSPRDYWLIHPLVPSHSFEHLNTMTGQNTHQQHTSDITATVATTAKV